VNKERALHIAFTAIVRELLRDGGDEGPYDRELGEHAPPIDGPQGPQPRFDFDESNDVCEHNGVLIPRAQCPVHGPEAEYVPSAEELDDINSDEPPSPIARAERIRKQREKNAGKERLFPEDIPMSGLGPPQDMP
jgi:hypothetical protein